MPNLLIQRSRRHRLPSEHWWSSTATGATCRSERGWPNAATAQPATPNAAQPNRPHKSRYGRGWSHPISGQDKLKMLAWWWRRKNA